MKGLLVDDDARRRGVEVGSQAFEDGLTALEQAAKGLEGQVAEPGSGGSLQRRRRGDVDIAGVDVDIPAGGDGAVAGGDLALEVAADL